ncbi:hypothetical protein Tco_1199759 [Tanacetum coccineum]
MVEHEKPLKKKDQILLDEEIAQRLEEELQAELEEEERLSSWTKGRSTVQSLELNRSEENHQPNPKGGIKYSFVPMDTKVVEGSKSQAEGSKKRTREELESDNSKKQKIDENVEAEVDDEAKMKNLMEIVPNDEVAIDAIPLATKSPIIVD